jgi:hypothetical protein
MEEQTKKLTLNLLRAWAASKTDPDAPVAFGGRDYSARDYVAAVEKNTPLGSAYCAFMEAAARQAQRPLDEFLRDSIRPQSPPAAKLADQDDRPARRPKPHMQG